MTRKPKPKVVLLKDYAALLCEHDKLRGVHDELLDSAEDVREERDDLADRVRELEADLVAERRIRAATIKIAHSVATAWVEMFANEARLRARDVAGMGAESDFEAFTREPVPSVKVEVTP